MRNPLMTSNRHTGFIHEKYGPNAGETTSQLQAGPGPHVGQPRVEHRQDAGRTQVKNNLAQHSIHFSL